MRLKALDEIYKIYTLLHRSACKISSKIRQTFSHFQSFIFKNSLIFPRNCLEFIISMKILQNFSIFCGEAKNLLDYQISWDFATEIVDFFRKIFCRSSTKVRKGNKVRKKLGIEKNPFELGLSKNTGARLLEERRSEGGARPCLPGIPEPSADPAHPLVPRLGLGG